MNHDLEVTVMTAQGDTFSAELANVTDRGAFLKTSQNLQFRDAVCVTVSSLNLVGEVVMVCPAPSGLVVAWDSTPEERQVLADLRDKADVVQPAAPSAAPKTVAPSLVPPPSLSAPGPTPPLPSATPASVASPAVSPVLAPSAEPRPMAPSTAPRPMAPSAEPRPMAPSTAPRPMAPSAEPGLMTPSTTPRPMAPSAEPGLMTPSTAPRPRAPSLPAPSPPAAAAASSPVAPSVASRPPAPSLPPPPIAPSTVPRPRAPSLPPPVKASSNRTSKDDLHDDLPLVQAQEGEKSEDLLELRTGDLFSSEFEAPSDGAIPLRTADLVPKPPSSSDALDSSLLAMAARDDARDDDYHEPSLDLPIMDPMDEHGNPVTPTELTDPSLDGMQVVLDEPTDMTPQENIERLLDKPVPVDVAKPTVETPVAYSASPAPDDTLVPEAEILPPLMAADIPVVDAQPDPAIPPASQSSRSSPGASVSSPGVSRSSSGVSRSSPDAPVKNVPRPRGPSRVRPIPGDPGRKEGGLPPPRGRSTPGGSSGLPPPRGRSVRGPVPPAVSPEPPNPLSAPAAVSSNPPASDAEPVTVATETPTPEGGLPQLHDDGYTVMFSSSQHYAAQYKSHIAHGGLVVQAAALPIGTQRMLALKVPGSDAYTVSARVIFAEGERLGFMLDSFNLHKAKLEAMGNGG